MSDTTLEFVKLGLQVLIATGALGAAIFGYMAKKAIQEVHVSLNSRLTQLIDKTEQASRAEGRDSMRTGDGLDASGTGGAGPAGPAGIQGPVGPQGQVGPQGISGGPIP